MGVVNIEFWNNAYFTKLNMMALKPEQAEQVRAYLLEKNIEKMSDFILFASRKPRNLQLVGS